MDLTEFDEAANKLIHPTAVIYPGVKIGKGTRIGAYAVIGGPAEKRGWFDRPGLGVVIGENCVISNHVTIDSGTERPTTIGNSVTMLRGSHAGHDVTASDGATISCNVMLGGHSEIGRGANIGLGAVLHQFSKVGSYCMVGMGSVVPKKKRLLPGKIYAGNPIRFLRENHLGLERSGVSREELQKAIEEYYAATRDWVDAE